MQQIRIERKTPIESAPIVPPWCRSIPVTRTSRGRSCSCAAGPSEAALRARVRRALGEDQWRLNNSTALQE